MQARGDGGCDEDDVELSDREAGSGSARVRRSNSLRGRLFLLSGVMGAPRLCLKNCIHVLNDLTRVFFGNKTI